MSKESHPLQSPYKPFKYPPDYQLAKLHQSSSMPGKSKNTGEQCPCCHEKLKVPFKSWWDRSIEKDFKSFGGAVVGYFWLLKLYSFGIVAVIIIYAGYLQYLTNYYCSLQHKKQTCAKLFGVWIVTNTDLKGLIQKQNDTETLARFFTLRAVLFLILLFVNVISVYVVRWFKVRHPNKVGVSSFSLLFKNIKSDKLQTLIERLKLQFGPFQVKQAFIIKKVQPFYSAYQEKLQTYYACRIEEKPKILDKLKIKLNKLNKFCSECEESFYNQGGRAIVVFQNLYIKQKILSSYQISQWKKVQMFFRNNYEEQFHMYCEQAPKPQQIIWKNIGIIERQNFKLKILSIVYFILIILFVYGFLDFFMRVIYIKQITEPLKSIITNIILIFMVFVALTFRSFMNKLSEMRFPNTYTRRTVFIVATTVLFHFIFYLFVPSSYLYFKVDLRGGILSLISNQSINFIIVQITLAGFDLMYCCWNKRKTQTENPDKPVGCQRILHQKIQYPRFPIEFKLIILFKIWSLITFFAFEVPLVLFLILVALIYLYIKDKKNVYYHYRMQTIDNQVQFIFLKIYSNIFSLYLLIIFLITQDNQLEMIIAGGATLFAIFMQTCYLTKLDPNDIQDRDQFVNMNLNDLEYVDSYQGRYEKFLHEARDDMIDYEIKQYLSRNGFGTMRTEDSLQESITQQLIK